MLVLGAVLVLLAGIFLIGEQNRIFTSKNRYFITVGNTGGLNEGNPVRLNGVNVGLVEKIELPEDPRQQKLTVRISIERQYEERIRADSTARIRTLGLLGDKYVEVTSGSPGTPVIPPSGTIPTAPATDVDKLIASGGDVVENLVRMSIRLDRILARVDRGEGLVGELTTGESGLSERIDATLSSAQRLMTDLEAGKGALGRALRDEAMADQLAGSLAHLESVLAQADSGEGLLPTLLRDAATREQFQSTLQEAEQTAAQLRRWTAEIEQNDGLVDRLLTDEAMGEKVSRDLESLVADLAAVAAKLERGEGSAAKLINDPQIYDAVNDIVVGINESKLLRWLIRSRQKKGIEKRYDEAVREQQQQQRIEQHDDRLDRLEGQPPPAAEPPSEAPVPSPPAPAADPTPTPPAAAARFPHVAP
jgi:phospholipid/cholesterol/gamma-HCH transport system substrate-binding protein